MPWATLPAAWCHRGDECIRFWPSKGTLVPARPRSRPYFNCATAKRQQTLDVRVTSTFSTVASASHEAEGVSMLGHHVTCTPRDTMSPHLSSASGSSKDPSFDSVAGNAGGFGVVDGGPTVESFGNVASVGDQVDGCDVIGGSANDTSGQSPPPFLVRYVAAHKHLKSLIEERLRSPEPISAEQRQCLAEQVRAPACMHAQVDVRVHARVQVGVCVRGCGLGMQHGACDDCVTISLPCIAGPHASSPPVCLAHLASCAYLQAFCIAHWNTTA